MIWTTRPRSERAGLAAIEAGAGAQIVLLHGVGLRSEAWNRQIDALAEAHQVTAFDMPGHGESAVRSEMSRVSDFADAVLAAIDGPAMVVGHSMGAMIALNLAVRAPDRVRGVVALNAVFERSPEAARAVQARAAELDGVSVADPRGALARWFGTDDTPERAAMIAALAGRSATRGAWWETVPPQSMSIEEVEALWAPIAEADDWAPLYAKVDAVRAMGAALRGEAR